MSPEGTVSFTVNLVAIIRYWDNFVDAETSCFWSFVFGRCIVQEKSMRCAFVQWIDEEWPPRAQQVMLTLWDMVDQFMEQSDRNMVDVMAERALKNELKEVKEALECEKEEWAREKQALIRNKQQLHVQWRFSQSCCTSLQAMVKNEVAEKSRIWIVVLCLIGVLVAMLFGVVLKMK